MTESLSDKIAGILNAAPVSFDPEDDIHEETAARVVDKTNDFNSEEEETLSHLRKKNIHLLEDVDKRYVGKDSSRKKLFGTEEWSSEVEEEDSLPDISGDEDVSESSESLEDDDHVAEEEEEDKDFKHLEDADVPGQVKKGLCVRQQLGMWESLLEIRIQLQKSVLIANKLPQTEVFNDIKEKSGSEYIKNVSKSKKCVADLLDKLLYLQMLILRKYPETKNLISNKSQENETKTESDEEIPSDTEDEQSNKGDDSDNDNEEAVPRKKLKLQDLKTEIDKRYNLYKPYQNDIIKKWDDKTRIVNSKPGNVVNSVSSQIEHILSDREKLIKRTQLKRSNFDIVGLPKSDPPSTEEYNENIFDDTDFYHQLLRELIEHKSADITDSVQLSRQWIQLQNLRSKMKRNIDTRATKGRKIRYIVHSKLVNFMAPIEENNWQDEAKSELYSSLFGKNQPKNTL